MKPDYDTLYHLYHVERLTAREIAERFDTYHLKVLRWLRAYGIERRASGHGLENRGKAAPTRDELFEMVHIQHLSYREIATIYNVDFTAIPFWLEKHQIAKPLAWHTRKHSTVALPMADELRELYEAGLSLAAIGDLYGYSDGPIRRLCDTYGIEKRRDGWDGGKRFICADGHIVRSTYERRVDDWLFANRIEHSYEPALPPDSHFHADFFANGWYVEVWGVTDSPVYDDRKRRKIALYRANALPLIEIPKHAFTKKRNNQWARLLSVCLSQTFPLT